MLVFTTLLATVAFLWGSVVCPPSPQEGHNISPRMVDSKCRSDSDCSDTALHTCDPELKVCKCREPSSMLSHSTGACLPAKQLGESCEEEGQCRLVEQNATCLNSSCVCDSGFYQKNDSINGTICIVDKSGGGENAPRGADAHMIVVLVALAVMFIGICVALHLYSKARGWTRRSIFNNPASRLLNIKLGKRRKSSVCAKHMPLPPPWGGSLLTRHNSFAGHHSPFQERRDPKTRSHECLQSALIHPEFPPKFEIQPPKKSPLAMNEDLDKKTPGPSQNGPLGHKVIITSASVVTSKVPPPSSPVNV